ncbi:MAG TPA: histidine triad nucleotide-binding protein [Usitatibacteraceae bacterium]|jgi:histidine triad (HIT) family protein|nr:histidine triad nucleotide-binding protein [Usitatibacteraceae bacterium]
MKKDDCIFCKIAAGEIPSRKVYEDGEILAFHDIQPVAPVHFLMIPTAHVASLAECGPEHAAVLGRMMAMAGRLAREQGATDGFRTIVNTGRVGRQDVYHLHIHIIGGPDRLPRMIAAE